MKKVLCLSTVLLCLSAGLFGCGDKKESKSKSDETTTAVTTSADTTAEDTTAGKKSEGDADVSAYLGKWECKEMIMDGEKMDNFYGLDAFALYQIELLDDNSGNFFSALEFKESQEYTKINWELSDDGTVTLTGGDFDDEDPLTMKLEDGKLVMDLSEADTEFITYLEKVDEFTEIPEDEEMSFSFSTEGDAEFEFDGSDPEADTTDAE
ncbi:hypothetical protein [Ruminococcus sp.]|uniref:hypothetical protein n=1 Tax=Ruminococcus sp. TaxID=41978 RepID=UPI002C692BC1|nr:hypothetical protein [Ruminococcus sp.]HOA00232.1 hypothetical protein [Ruminococcus sp.]HOH87516.1 hypothetical protein [Ruminococcus sp.]